MATEPRPKQPPSCDTPACKSARLTFERKRLDYDTKKAAHDSACRTLAKWEGRLLSFLKWAAGIAATAGASYITAAITIAVQSLATGAGVAAALAAVGTALGQLAGLIAGIPGIGFWAAIAVVAALAGFAAIVLTYYSANTDEATTGNQCRSALQEAQSAYLDAVRNCPHGCVTSFSGNCSCPP